MIKTGKTSDFDAEYISIDLASSKHKNRVLDLFASVDALGQNWEYEIRAQWTSSKFHPTMVMTENDLIQLATALNKWVGDIQARRAAKP